MSRGGSPGSKARSFGENGCAGDYDHVGVGVALDWDVVVFGPGQGGVRGVGGLVLDAECEVAVFRAKRVEFAVDVRGRDLGWGGPLRVVPFVYR